VTDDYGFLLGTWFTGIIVVLGSTYTALDPVTLATALAASSAMVQMGRWVTGGEAA